jgi:hypothetical protein
MFAPGFHDLHYAIIGSLYDEVCVAIIGLLSSLIGEVD